jgi:predicted nucleic acid-binding protein
LLIAEPSSDAMQGLYASDPGVLVWWTSETECVSALARLEREGALSTRATEHALDRLDALAGRWSEVQPTDPVRRTARRLLRTHPLRAADAFQLAAALAAAEGDTTSIQVVCLDDRLSHAARREGFTVLSI